MTVGFVDLEKAYDTVPREMVTASVRSVGVPETKAGIVEAMYERTKGELWLDLGCQKSFQLKSV